MHFRIGRVRLFGFVAFLFLAGSALAQTRPIPAFRVAKAPVVDGIIGEDEWKDVPFVEGLKDEATGADYADSGRFWLSYDDKFVYFAARLKDSDPRNIRATEYRTNTGMSGDDWVRLELDLSGSLSAFNSFQMNPLGATNIQIAGGRASKREWLGAMIAKGRITESGWECEAQIPWQAMSIPRAGVRDLRVNFTRYVARTQRTFTNVFTGNGQNALTPTWAKVILPKQAVDRSIKLLPYAYVGYDKTSKDIVNGGLDLKTALSEQINLVGSINPDFRNIENQILSIDFSRFERLAGETRPFFQEGRQYSGSALFASQRIPSFDVGINSYGRISNTTSFGFLNTVDFGHRDNMVFNVTHDPDPTTSIRAAITNFETPGISNQAYLVRYSKQFGPYGLQLRDLGSKDTKFGFGRHQDASVSYSKGEWNVFSRYSRVEREFRPRLGFFPEVDYKGPFIEVDYQKSFDKGRLNDWGFTTNALTYDRVAGKFYRNEWSGEVFTTLRSGFFTVLSADLQDFEGSKDSLYSVNMGFPRSNPFTNISGQFDTGRQAGAGYQSFSLNGAYRLTKKFQLTMRHQTVSYFGVNEQTIFSANYDLGNDRSISGRAVKRGKDMNAYLAFRRSGNEGIEYFLILGDPNAPRFRSSLILKVTVPMEFGRHGLSMPWAQRHVISGPAKP